MTRFVSTWDRITRASEAKGHKAGKLEGRAAMFLAMLRLRFGSVPRVVSARVARATPPQLDRLAARFVRADRLDAVFDE